MYDHKKIEVKWRKYWAENKIYQADLDKAKKPFYNLMMFPYPSAEGLHVGNMYAFVHSDAYGRFKRLQGFDVFEPIGLDGFGIHSENYAIKIKEHIKDVSARTEKHFYEQLHEIGNAYDWTRTVETYKPDYYKWTQWLFLKMFERGLAYRKAASVNWCPSCKTVLSDEQVIAGHCERCDALVEKRQMEQWFWRITDYAPKLLSNLETLDWSEEVKTTQKNWIGRSEGALVKFEVTCLPARQGSKKLEVSNELEVFTTRPDTLFGCTYMVVSPEHSIISDCRSRIANYEEVNKYIEESRKKSEIERADETREKTGVKLEGLAAVNPVNNKEIPIFVADYVLAGYGTGAIMAVPAHDQRDYDFAVKYGLPVVNVIEPVTGKPAQNEDFRRSIVAIVRDPATGRFLSINWGRENGGNLFIGGGREEGEDAESAARREIKEETGYTDLKLLAQSEVVHHHYYAFAKKTARNIEAVGLYFELDGNGNAGQKLDDYENGKFKMEWISPEEAESKVEDELHAYLFGKFIKNKVFTGNGINVNSGFLDGLETDEAKRKMNRWLEQKGLGKGTVNFKLRDWCVSRQRYWGPPIPVIYCENCKKLIEKSKNAAESPRGDSAGTKKIAGFACFAGGQGLRISDYIFSRGEVLNPGWIAVPEKDLPVLLPEMDDFLPDGTGKGPLNKIADFVNVKCPKCGSGAKRETDVSDPFVDSSWYFMRYLSTDFDDRALDKDRLAKWMPVDMYIGGKEHSVLHLLYSRFVTMVMHDLGLAPEEEPYRRFRAHGLLIRDGAKISKSKGNIVNPDEYIERYGADAVRMYLMFLGDMRQGGDWRDTGMAGMFRFIKRIYGLLGKFQINAKSLPAQAGETLKPKQIQNSKFKIQNFSTNKLLHKTIKGVGDDLENLKYNTAIAKLMTLVNGFEKNGCGKAELEVFSVLLAPFAPFLAEELWFSLAEAAADKSGESKFSLSIFRQKWPAYDPALVKDETINLVVQVNGKLRATIEAPADISEADARELALNDEKIGKWLADKKVVKVIFVKGKLVNIVIS